MWYLSLKVSQFRIRLSKVQNQENERAFFNYNRAHINTSENVPMLSLLFLAHRALFPETSQIIQATMVIITISRFFLVLGLIKNAAKPSTPRLIGASLTLLGGVFLSATLILKGLGVQLPF